jgi:hypothetical protein
MLKTFWLYGASVLLLALVCVYEEIEAQQGGRDPRRGPGPGAGRDPRGPGGGGPGGGAGRDPRGPGGGRDPRGPGGGRDRPGVPGGPGNPAFRFQDLNIEDLRPEGRYEVISLIPTINDQPRIGLAGNLAYRLADYEPETNTLTFATVNLEDGQLASRDIRLPGDAPKFNGMPRVSYDSGSHAVISQQAAVVFVDVANGRTRVASGFDSSVPVAEGPPRRRRGGGRGGPGGWPDLRDDTNVPDRAYRVYGGADGAHALSMLQVYDRNNREFTGRDGVLHSASGRSVSLSWSHREHGVPPRGRDAVFAVTGDEIIVMALRPKDPGNSESWLQVNFLVFNARNGSLKEVQEVPGNFSSRNRNHFYLSPCGDYFVAHPEDGIHMAMYRRGTWESMFRTSYNDPVVGFAPEGGIVVLLENLSSQRAALKAMRLSDQEVLWQSSLPHDQARGNDDRRPFTAVGPGASMVASVQGVIAGKQSDSLEFVYTAEAVDFEPLAMTYDSNGRSVAVLARDRVFVLDARTREETASIPFEEPLPEGAVGEFISFDPRARKVLACVRGHGAWLMDVSTQSIEHTLPAIPGNWARAMPDLSSVIYSQPSNQGGHIMLQPVNGGEATRLYENQSSGVQAVCLWVSERGDEFLVVERGGGAGRLYLVNARGEKVVEYPVQEADSRVVGDNALTAFVTRRRQVVMISEASLMARTGINCTVISPDSGVESTFTCLVVTDELPGSSTYGQTSASPFFGGLHSGDERTARFACPAGMLEIDISRQRFTLYAWSRSPQGLAAVNPRGREFFVAGASGLTSYRVR